MGEGGKVVARYSFRPFARLGNIILGPCPHNCGQDPAKNPVNNLHLDCFTLMRLDPRSVTTKFAHFPSISKVARYIFDPMPEEIWVCLQRFEAEFAQCPRGLAGPGMGDDPGPLAALNSIYNRVQYSTYALCSALSRSFDDLHSYFDFKRPVWAHHVDSYGIKYITSLTNKAADTGVCVYRPGPDGVPDVMWWAHDFEGIREIIVSHLRRPRPTIVPVEGIDWPPMLLSQSDWLACVPDVSPLLLVLLLLLLHTQLNISRSSFGLTRRPPPGRTRV